jgi:hypothetical protein
MSLNQDLKRIGDDALAELDAVFNFLKHSEVVWESFARFVQDGHELSVEVTPTGNKANQDDLIHLAPLYNKKYLMAFTFRQFVSVFEAFLFNFMHRVLLHNPWQFARCTLEVEVVLRSADKDEVLSGIILKQLNEIRYEQIRAWFVTLNKSLKLDCPSDKEIDTLAEIKAARDIIEHNSGIVNATYLRKAKAKARFAVGDLLELDDDYHFDSWSLCRKIVVDICAAGISKSEEAISLE